MPKPTAAPAPARTASRSPTNLSERQKALLGWLGNPQNPNRPTTQKALVALVKSRLGKDATDANVAELMQFAKTRDVLSIDAQQKVIYART